MLLEVANYGVGACGTSFCNQLSIHAFPKSASKLNCSLAKESKHSQKRKSIRKTNWVGTVNGSGGARVKSLSEANFRCPNTNGTNPQTICGIWKWGQGARTYEKSKTIRKGVWPKGLGDGYGSGFERKNKEWDFFVEQSKFILSKYKSVIAYFWIISFVVYALITANNKPIWIGTTLDLE